jgi:CheY-like chemotaxis protein
LEKIRENKPAVILLDICIPGLNGYEVAAQMRKQKIEPRPHVIAVTGYGLESDVKKAQEAGIDQFLVKPVDPAQLNEMLAGL